MKQMVTSYLLGDLSEPEQVALEEKYFADSRLFDQVVRVEQELVDDYARDRLSPQVRRKFERHYLSHPHRRERAKFAEALSSKLDQLAEVEAASQVKNVSWWRNLLAPLSGYGLAPKLAVALASLLIVIGGWWSFGAMQRQRRELAEARASYEQRERELEQQAGVLTQQANGLEQQLAAERARAEELAAELERLRARQQSSRPRTPSPAPRPVPAFVSLLLTAGGVRSVDTGAPPTLSLPPGTQQVRLQLNLTEHDYPGYRVALRTINGAEILRRQNLQPAITKSGARFRIDVPARKFAAGDYVLTLSGVNQDGEIDDLSKSIFRINKK